MPFDVGKSSKLELDSSEKENNEWRWKCVDVYGKKWLEGWGENHTQ